MAFANEALPGRRRKAGRAALVAAALTLAPAGRAQSPIQPPDTASAASRGTPAIPPDGLRPRKPHGKPKVEGVLNVNRASEAELRLLPGIGKGRASAIVERRSKREFANLDELARMKGMRRIVQRLRRHLAVKGDTTIHPASP